MLQQLVKSQKAKWQSDNGIEPSVIVATVYTSIVCSVNLYKTVREEKTQSDHTIMSNPRIPIGPWFCA